MSLWPHFIEEKLTRRWHREILHYLWVGFLATSSQYVVLIFCVEVLHLHAVLGSSIGYLFGGSVNYILNRSHTFYSQKRHHHAIALFSIVFIIAFLLNASLLHFIQSTFKWHYMTAQLLTTTLVLVWNYLASKFWTFR
jgi:putative flippase GtrA